MARYFQAKSGSYTGTGSAIQLNLNFQPKRFEIVDETSGTVQAYTLQTSAKASAYINSAGTLSYVTTNGFTFGPQGMLIGTNASINTAAHVYRWFAFA